MVWQPNILNNCYELSGGYAPPEPPTRGSADGPRWGTSVPQTPCAPPPNPGCTTGKVRKLSLEVNIDRFNRIFSQSTFL